MFQRNCILNRNHHRRLFQYAVLAVLAEDAGLVAALAVELALLQVAAVLPVLRVACPDGYLLAEASPLVLAFQLPAAFPLTM